VLQVNNANISSYSLKTFLSVRVPSLRFKTSASARAQPAVAWMANRNAQNWSPTVSGSPCLPCATCVQLALLAVRHLSRARLACRAPPVSSSRWQRAVSHHASLPGEAICHGRSACAPSVHAVRTCACVWSVGGSLRRVGSASAFLSKPSLATQQAQRFGGKVLMRRRQRRARRRPKPASAGSRFPWSPWRSQSRPPP